MKNFKRITTLVCLVAVVAISTLLLVACNNATTQGQLENILWQTRHEEFVYSVKDTAKPAAEAEIGTYKVSMQLFERGSKIENFGSVTLSDLKYGILILSELNIEGGAQYKTGVYFNIISGPVSYMLPAYSFRTETDGDKTFTLQGVYDGSTFMYTRTIDGVEDTGALKASGTYFDNNEFAQVLRTANMNGNNGISLAFAVPLVSRTEAAVVSLSARATATTKIKTPYTDGVDDLKEEGIDCYRVNVTRSTQVVSKKSQTYYYAIPNVKGPSADHPEIFAMKNVLVKMVEPYRADDGEFYDIEYDLVSASVIA